MRQFSCFHMICITTYGALTWMKNKEKEDIACYQKVDHQYYKNHCFY
jgi:hypothetical protein